MTPSVDDAFSQKTRQEVVAVLVHMKKLLRVRNRLSSPLLRLPTETIVRILSFLMADLDRCYFGHIWSSIYSTCHRIHRIMCNATELWWKVDCARSMAAHFTFVRSKGCPRVILSDLRSANDGQLANTEKMLDHWKDEREFRGHRLHTLEFFGTPSSFDHFSWILKHSLPRLDRLKINVTGSFWEDDLPVHVALEFPVNASLRVLDLSNVTLSWSSQSHLFNGLRELHLNFGARSSVVIIPEDELFGILDASPQLERLSLVKVEHEVPVTNGEPDPPKRIIQLPNLMSLKLDNDSLVVKYTLSYMDLPVIASLEIRSGVPFDIAQTLNNSLFPDDRIPARLFPNPPTFAVRTVDDEGLQASTEIEIGSIKLRFDFPFAQGERGRDVVMSCIPWLVPSSVTTLKLDYTYLDEQGWRDFFTSHPDVRSIECAEFCTMSVSRSLWDGLSPAGEGDTGVPCPRLESISITSYAGDMLLTPLSDCLRNRQTAGFKLRCLKMTDYHRSMTNMDGFREEFGPLVGTVETSKPNRFSQRVSPVSMRELY